MLEHGTFVGWIDDGVLHSLYRAADVCVVPSIYEPFGLVALEAMASGCPCIVADTGGLREVVPHDAVGLRFPAGDASALADLTARVLADHELGQRLVAEAREHGDLSENAEYHAARERQSFIEGRVAELEDKMARAEVIDISHLSGKTVKFGATVTLVDEDTDEKKIYQIVGEVEADVKNGRISISSPIARALIGKSVGDSVEVAAPGGAHGYEILKIKFG